MDYQLDLNWNDFCSVIGKAPGDSQARLQKLYRSDLPDELAGLAMENEVDSRLVSHQDGRWQVAHGPSRASTT